jgi:hypothetical protein
MKISYSENDVIEGYRLHICHILLLKLAFCLLGVSILFYFVISVLFGLLIFITLFILMFLYLLQYLTLGKTKFRTETKYSKQWNITFIEKGLSIEVGQDNEFIKWDDFISIKSNQKLYLLYFDTFSFLILPKRFISEQEMEQIENNKNKLQSPK